jgi:hypothetical protein
MARSTARNSACSDSAARDTSGWNATSGAATATAGHRPTRRAAALALARAARGRAHATGLEQQLAVAVIAARRAASERTNRRLAAPDLARASYPPFGRFPRATGCRLKWAQHSALWIGPF